MSGTRLFFLELVGKNQLYKGALHAVAGSSSEMSKKVFT